jgi:hypothetical protein
MILKVELSAGKRFGEIVGNCASFLRTPLIEVCGRHYKILAIVQYQLREEILLVLAI